jgi:hypothetical protein
MRLIYFAAIIAIVGATQAIAIQATAQGNPQQLLQGLLSGNQGQDQAVRDAYERGYQRGRQDGTRREADRGGPDRGRGGSDERQPYQQNPSNR